jgi:hypothetical protein
MLRFHIQFRAFPYVPVFMNRTGKFQRQEQAIQAVLYAQLVDAFRFFLVQHAGAGVAEGGAHALENHAEILFGDVAE